MNQIKTKKIWERVPGLRILVRLIIEIYKPAPLDEFANYTEYWCMRDEYGRTNQILNRFVVIEKLIKNGDKVLDIGCGDGSFMAYLKNRKEDIDALGIDISPEAVKLAKAKGLKAELISQNDNLKDKIPTGWDVITLMEIIEHHVDAEVLIRQVIDLEPKKIFITIPNVGCLKHRLRLMLGGRFPVTSIHFHMKEHVRFWTPKDFREWCQILGLNVVNIYGQVDRGDTLVKLFTKKLPALFADRVIYELTMCIDNDKKTKKSSIYDVNYK